jgi:nitrate reductase gamma subunit
MTNQFRIQLSQENTASTVADIFNVAAIALTSVLGLLTIAATI